MQPLKTLPADWVKSFFSRKASLGTASGASKGWVFTPACPSSAPAELGSADTKNVLPVKQCKGWVFTLACPSSAPAERGSADSKNVLPVKQCFGPSATLDDLVLEELSDRHSDRGLPLVPTVKSSDQPPPRLSVLSIANPLWSELQFDADFEAFFDPLPDTLPEQSTSPGSPTRAAPALSRNLDRKLTVIPEEGEGGAESDREEEPRELQGAPLMASSQDGVNPKQRGKQGDSEPTPIKESPTPCLLRVRPRWERVACRATLSQYRRSISF